MFLYARCGSAVMRQTVVSAEALRLCGSGILPGCRRALSEMCRLVVSVSQTVFSASTSSSRMLRLDEASACSLEAFFMCARRAFEALRVCWG